MTEDFVARLRQRLSEPLPGTVVRGTLAPQLSYGRHDGPPSWDARQAAVLILIYRDGGNWRVPLTLRPDTLPHHSGQVSLPGGEIESGETPEAAARRELMEELGVAPEDLAMLGRLSPIFVYASNFLVTPCVALTRSRPDFVPNPAEVANLLEPTLVEMFEPRSCSMRVMRRKGVVFQAPQVVLYGQAIWGATRMVLAEFGEIVRHVGKVP